MPTKVLMYDTFSLLNIANDAVGSGMIETAGNT